MASVELTDSQSYECEICDDTFDSKRSKAIHFGYHPTKEKKEVYLDELERLADELSRTPTESDMKEHGRFGSNTYNRHFETWNKALQEADLELNNRKNIPEGELLIELKRLADKLGRTPTESDMNEYGKYSERPYRNHFGAWNNSLKEIDLELTHQINIPEGELLNELKRLADKLGRTPSARDMRQCGEYSEVLYQDRFGSWNKALKESELELNQVSPGEGEPTFLGPNWDEKRSEAIERDEYQCRVCGLTEEEHSEKYNNGLDVHHITPVKLFGDIVEERDYSEVNDLENLVTLCQQCHYEYGDRSNLDPRWTEYNVDEFVFFAQLDRDIQ